MENHGKIMEFDSGKALVWEPCSAPAKYKSISLQFIILKGKRGLRRSYKDSSCFNSSDFVLINFSFYVVSPSFKWKDSIFNERDIIACNKNFN